PWEVRRARLPPGGTALPRRPRRPGAGLGRPLRRQGGVPEVLVRAFRLARRVGGQGGRPPVLAPNAEARGSLPRGGAGAALVTHARPRSCCRRGAARTPG